MSHRLHSTLLLTAICLALSLPLQAAPADKDDDGFANNVDNCPNDPNPDQLDTDTDNKGNVCDNDDDNDNVSDADETLNHSDPLVADTDDDGLTDDVDPAPIDQLGILHALDGDGSNEKAGSAVASGDLNNDGHDEILLGTPYDRIYTDDPTPIALSKAGSIKVYDGASGDILFAIEGSIKNQRLGMAIAIAPDQNSDGTPDILVGEPFANITTFVNEKTVILKAAGRVSLYSGEDGAFITTVAEGKKAGDNFGTAIAVGNIDNTGSADLVVGEPLADISILINSKPVTFANAGRITAFTGISNTEMYHRDGVQKNARFGTALAVEPFDKRVIVGEPGFDVPTIINSKNIVLPDAGRVQVFPGSNGLDEANLTVNGTTAKEYFGTAVAALDTDLNADNEMDWLAGSPRADITVYRNKPIIKKDAGMITLFSDDSAVASINGSLPADRLGSSVATGDINDDGMPDLLPGSPQFDPSTFLISSGKTIKLPNAGRAVAYDGSIWLP